VKAKTAAVVAGFSMLAGVLCLAFSPGAGRVPLGTMLIIISLGGFFTAFRRRAASN